LDGPYNDKFRQGATILPRSFYFARIRDLDGSPDFERIYWAQTDAEQAESAKPHYNEIVIDGRVEGRFIFSSALSKHLLPFALLAPATIVVPVVDKNGELSVLTSEGLHDRGFREFGKWMRQVEETWTAKRDKKADKQTVYERLDYQKELTEQNLNDRHLVLYSTSGTNISAAYVDRTLLPLRFLIDHKTYWGTFHTADEAHYLVAILNCEAVNEIIKPFQSLGLMGERDIHKKVLDVTFPPFDKDKPKHSDLVRLARAAATEAYRVVRLPAFPNHLPRQRAYVRQAVEDTMKEIDAVVKTLI
jgi:hypothetical protein